MTSTGGLALSTAERVVDGVHGDASDRGPLVLPTSAAGLARRDQLGLGVAHLAHGRAALDLDHPHLTRRQTQGRAVSFFGDQLNRRARGAGHLAAGAGLQLDVVNHGTDRDVPERQRVPRPDVGAGAGLDEVTHLHPVRHEDVALLSVLVVEEGDPRVAVRVVLHVSNLGGNGVLVALEVDDSVTTLVAAALVARRDPAVVVAARLLRLRLDERLLRLRPSELREVGDRLEPASR